MVMDIDTQNIKYIRYTKPESLSLDQLQYKRGDVVQVHDDKNLTFRVDTYTIPGETDSAEAISVWVGSKDAVLQQLGEMHTLSDLPLGVKSPLIFVVNAEKLASGKSVQALSSSTPSSSAKKNSSPVSMEKGQAFTVNDITL